jgi:gliding motility-associated-like protein
MYRILLLFPFLFFAAGSLSKLPPPVVIGIQTNHDYPVEELVKDVFLKGDCDNVSNIKAIGNDLSIGYFEGGSSIFGFPHGVLLTSGDIAFAEGPNGSVESGEQFGSPSNDPDINLFANNAAFDVGGIEFDFVPVGETVTFRYVFASEEYCEFVGSIFNDVFGFFVSGPGINGPYANSAINVAVIPGTGDFVAINSVNHTTNAASYIGNELQMDANQCGIPFQQTYQDQIGYDGMTVPFTATVQVVPCETYHIRLVVADVGDDNLDSGVFLETESFDLGGGIGVVAAVPGSDEPIAVEGCLDGQFIFTRTTADLTDPLTVNFTISPISTAENGVDFSAIPNSITIPAGQSSAILPIHVLADGLSETQESLTIQLNFPCDCQDPVSTTLLINDQIPFEVGNTEIEVCAGQDFSIGPTILGGLTPFSYLWQDGSTDSLITSTLTQTTAFNVTITDACGAVEQAAAMAIIQPVPKAEISGESSLCAGQSGTLEIEFGGNPPWSFQYAIDGQTQPAITDIFQSPFMLTVTKTGFYELVQFSDAQCEGTGGSAIDLQAAGAQVQYTVSPPSCLNAEDGAIELTIAGGLPPYDLAWSPAVDDPQHPTGLLAGIYQLEVTDATGCTTVETIALSPSNSAGKCKPYSLYVPNAFSPNEDGFNDEFRFFPAENSNIAQVKSLHIFNRWGAVVFEKKEFQPDADLPLWDGRFKGKIMDAGLYVWQAILILEEGQEEVAAGELMLVR